MAHAIRGGESRRRPAILSKAMLFWAMFAVLGIGGSYAIDHSVGLSADLASLALPNDAQLEGDWISGPLRLRSVLHGQTMTAELWRDRPRHRWVATYLLERGSRQGELGWRHRFVSPDSGIAISLTGGILTLELPSNGAGRKARRLAFSRPNP